jgi:hypothetical protein
MADAAMNKRMGLRSKRQRKLTNLPLAAYKPTNKIDGGDPGRGRTQIGNQALRLSSAPKSTLGQQTSAFFAEKRPRLRLKLRSTDSENSDAHKTDAQCDGVSVKGCTI